MSATALYRTRLCKYNQERSCYKGVDCVFAHSEAELRPINRPEQRFAPRRSDAEAKPDVKRPHWKAGRAPRDQHKGKWKASHASLTSSTLSTASSTLSKSSEVPEEVLPASAAPEAAPAPAPVSAPAEAPVPASTPSFCRGVPCQKSLELMPHGHMSLGVPIGAGRGFVIGLPPFCLDSFRQSLLVPYEL